MSSRAKPVEKQSKLESFFMYPFKKGWPSIALAGLFVLSIFGAGLYSISNPAKPGDKLFFIDRGFERSRLRLTVSDTAKYKQKVAIAQERLEELLDIDQSDLDKALLSINELDRALRDIKTNIVNVVELDGAHDSANKVVDNLIELVARYKAFLLGDDDSTDEIQNELNDSVDKINDIVTVVNKNSPVTAAKPVEAAPEKKATTTAPASSGSGSSTPPTEADCDSTYQLIGNEVEYSGVTLQKNSCGNYTAIIGSKTKILITGNNLDYALGKKVKFHANTGTNDSLFLTEFEIDD